MMATLSIIDSEPQAHATTQLRASAATAFRARYAPGDLTGAIYSAARCARRDDTTYYVYPGNSFMVAVYRIGTLRDALCPVNCSGTIIYQVDPDYAVTLHRLVR